MTRDCRGHRSCVIMFFANALVGGEECLSGPISSASAGRRLGHNDKQRARAETRGRSRELIAGGRHERQIVLALSNDRMFLAAVTIGCRPSACASPTIPKQVGHNHLGFSCRQHAGCRPAGDCRSAEPELGPTTPPHSITSSAVASSLAGISNLRVLAVWTLMISSNLVARSIGRSAGFAPLRMRPA